MIFGLQEMLKAVKNTGFQRCIKVEQIPTLLQLTDIKGNL